MTAQRRRGLGARGRCWSVVLRRTRRRSDYLVGSACRNGSREWRRHGARSRRAALRAEVGGDRCGTLRPARSPVEVPRPAARHRVLAPRGVGSALSASPRGDCHSPDRTSGGRGCSPRSARTSAPRQEEPGNPPRVKMQLPAPRPPRPFSGGADEGPLAHQRDNCWRTSRMISRKTRWARPKPAGPSARSSPAVSVQLRRRSGR